MEGGGHIVPCINPIRVKVGLQNNSNKKLSPGDVQSNRPGGGR